MKKLLLILLCLPMIGFGQQTYVPTRDITYTIVPPFTTTTITVDGINIAAFPMTFSYPINQIVNISANLDPLYEFSYWATDSVLLSPSSLTPVASFFASYSDTVRLYIVISPTNINEQSIRLNKELVSTINVLGQEVKIAANQPLFYIYDDGTVEKRIVIE
jgi:hypothetical protein